MNPATPVSAISVDALQPLSVAGAAAAAPSFHAVIPESTLLTAVPLLDPVELAQQFAALQQHARELRAYAARMDARARTGARLLAMATETITAPME